MRFLPALPMASSAGLAARRDAERLCVAHLAKFAVAGPGAGGGFGCTVPQNLAALSQAS